MFPLAQNKQRQNAKELGQMKLRKMILSAMAATMLVSALTMSASANSVDTSYSIPITGSGVGYDSHEWRVKENSTSAYVKATGGPASFIGVVYGGLPNTDIISDCTTYEIYSGSQRSPAVIRVGQKGYIRQDVYERYGGYSTGCVAKLAGKYHSATGTSTGVWSPDSIYESGCIYFN
jgi:hypothetical protein